MEGMLSASDKQSMVSSFLEIAVGQTAETAMQFLQATSWKLDEALQLFYVGNEGGVVAPASESPAADNVDSLVDQNSGELNESGTSNVGPIGGEEVRPPLPVVRETLYDDASLYGLGLPPQQSGSLVAFRNFDEEMKQPGVWESDEARSSSHICLIEIREEMKQFLKLLAPTLFSGRYMMIQARGGKFAPITN
ncbi:hypothetical protein V6N13_017229 [Hibiscus sabdariffa]